MRTRQEIQDEIDFLYLYPPGQMWKIKELEQELKGVDDDASD